MSANIEGLSSVKQHILAELCENHKCDVVCMQETHRGPGAVRPRVPGMILVAEIAHKQYGSALFIRESCPCESISTSNTDNIEIIQTTLNGMTVKRYYKLPNQGLRVIICDFSSHTVIAQNGDTEPQIMTAP